MPFSSAHKYSFGYKAGTTRFKSLDRKLHKYIYKNKITFRIKSKTSSNFYSKDKSNNLFFEKNSKSRLVNRGNRTKSFFQISKKHVKRDINKYDLNPSYQKENSKPRNQALWVSNYEWGKKGIKIKNDIIKNIKLPKKNL